MSMRNFFNKTLNPQTFRRHFKQIQCFVQLNLKLFFFSPQGLIEMKSPADAEKVVAAANMNKITVAGKHPKILVSTKHAHLNKWYWIVIYALHFCVL